MKKRFSLTLITLVLIAAVALCAVVIGGEFSPRGVRRAWAILVGRVDATFTFEAGLSEVFADLDGSVVTAGGAGFAVYDRHGNEISRAGYSMKAPSIAVGGGLAVVYDVGGHSVRAIYGDGTHRELPIAGEISSVSVGLGGEFAVCSSASDEYKGKAAFYKMQSGTPTLVYEWYSGEGYIVGAAVSPNGKSFAVNTLTPRGGRIVLLNAGSPDLAAEYIYARGVVLEMAFDKSGALTARTLDGVHILNAAGTKTAEIDFDSGEPDGYARGAGYIAVHFVGTNNANSALVVYDLKGGSTGKLETSRRLVSLTASGNRIAALWSDGLDIYDSSLRLIASYPDASGSKFAFPRGGEAAVVMNTREGRAFARQSVTKG